MTRCYCYIGADGRVCADNHFANEDDAWRVMLGWPTRGEVKAAKARGDKVVLVDLSVVPPHPPTAGESKP